MINGTWWLRLVAVSMLVVMLGIAWQIQHATNVTATMLAIGQYDTRWLDSVYPLEGQTTQYRWTKPVATLRLPVLQTGWNIGMLELQSGQRDAMTRVETTMTLAGGQQVTLQVAYAPRRFWVVMAPASRTTWSIPVNIHAPLYRVDGDNRELGVVVTRLGVVPTQSATGVAYATVMLIAIWALLVAICYLIDLPWPVSLVSATGLTVGAVAICMRHVVETLPHWHWLATWLLICAVALVVIRLMRVTIRDHAGRWVVPGIALPELMALAWWMLPVFQMMLINDDIYLRYHTYQPWMGSVVVGTIVLSTAVAWWQRTPRVRIPYLHIWVACVGLLFVAVSHEIILTMPMFRYSSGDFEIWLNTAKRWVDTGVLYVVDKVADNPFAVYKRPPFYIMLFTPFAHQESKAVLDAYRWLNIGLFVATVLIWLRMMRVNLWWWVASIMLLLNFQALYDTIAYGQTDVVLLFCFTCMLWATRQRRDGWTGAIIAFLTMCKIYPVLLLVFFVIKRRWWVIWGFLIGMVLYNASAIAVIGWPIHVQYIREVLPSIGGTTSWVENQTIAGFLTRFYDNPFVMLRFQIKAIERIATLISACVSALVCLAALRDVPEDDSAFAVQYGMFVMLMVVAIPVAWMHYTTLLLLVFFIMVWHYQQHHISLAAAATLAVSYALVAFGTYKSFNYPTHLGIVSILMGSYKLYGMLMLTALMLTTIWRRHESWAAHWINDAQRVVAFIRARRASSE